MTDIKSIRFILIREELIDTTVELSTFLKYHIQYRNTQFRLEKLSDILK